MGTIRMVVTHPQVNEALDVGSDSKTSFMTLHDFVICFVGGS